jgi:tetratricopeptide (TPR) repeat protein
VPDRTALQDAFKAKDWDRTVDLAEQILATDPADVDALRYLVRVHTNRKDRELALPLWQRLTELTPDAPEPYLQLARLYRHDRDWPAAAAQIERFLPFNAIHPEALQIQVEAYIQTRKMTKIGAAFRALSQEAPAQASVLARQIIPLGMTEDLAHTFRAMADAGDATLIQHCANLARDQRNAALGFEIQRNVFSAAQNYRVMRILDPTSTYPTTSLARLRKPYLERARKAYQDGQYERAIELAQDCIRIEPQEAEPHVIAGRSALRNGDQPRSYQLLRTGILSAQPDIWLTLNFARVAEREGYARIAYDAFTAVRQSTEPLAVKHHDEADRSLGRLPQRMQREVMTTLDDGQYEKAMAQCDGLIADGLMTDPEQIAEMRQRICTHTQRQLRLGYDANDFSILPLAEALAAFAPDQPYAFRLAGRLHMRARAYKRALPFWEALITQEPDSVEFHLNLARCHDRLGDSARAALAAAGVLRLEPDHSEARDLSGA